MPNFIITKYDLYQHLNNKKPDKNSKYIPPVPAITLQNNILAGLFLVGAGAFQFTSLKDTCLEKCRNPLSFLMAGPIKGYGNVAYVGLKHGLFCLGCCWVLMLLLFVNGVMNLLWVVAITIIVLAEKMLPYEKLSSRFLGILLVGWGAYLIFI